jgi:putative ABC transport system permease protein
MNLTSIAVKNLNRRKGKMLLLVASLSIATATLVLVIAITFAFKQGVSGNLNQYGYSLVVSPKVSRLNLTYGGMTVSQVFSAPAATLQLDDAAKLDKKLGTHLRAVSPKLLKVVKVEGKKMLMVGLNIDKERQVKKWWQLERGRYPRKPNEVIIGYNLAEKFNIPLNKKLLIENSGFIPTAVLFETGSHEDDVIFVDLAQMQKIFSRSSQVDLIEVATSKGEEVDSMARKIARILPTARVDTLKQSAQLKQGIVGDLSKFNFGIGVIIVLISVVIVFTTMAASVNRRKSEIGIFRAIGYRQSKIIQIILTEAFLLSVVAGFIGYLGGFVIFQLLSSGGKEIGQIAVVSLILLPVSLLLSVAMAMAGSLIPAWQAAHLEPAESLKSL